MNAMVKETQQYSSCSEPSRHAQPPMPDKGRVCNRPVQAAELTGALVGHKLRALTGRQPEMLNAKINKVGNEGDDTTFTLMLGQVSTLRMSNSTLIY